MRKSSKTPAKVQGTKTTIGDLEYDAQQQTLRHGERLASLTLCEPKIVAYLFRNQSRPVAANELLRDVLGSKARQKSTAVERHVCDIRKKLAAINAETTIRTVRHQGYFIV